MTLVVFVISAAIILIGALGVVFLRNPVHNALALVATLFGVAVLFVEQEAHFLAAVQVIVYAGAIVVLFLFVIMLLGVDKAEDLEVEPLAGQRPLAVAAGGAALALTLVFLIRGSVTGAPGRSGLTLSSDEVSDVVMLGRSIFTQHIYAFEITAALLVIAVLGAVILARRPPSPVDEEAS